MREENSNGSELCFSTLLKRCNDTLELIGSPLSMPQSGYFDRVEHEEPSSGILTSSSVFGIPT